MHPGGTMSSVSTSTKECVFCGEAGKLTKEHVLPRHWQDDGLFPDVSETTFRRMSGMDGGVVDRTVYGTRFESKVKKVCGVCNSTWMNQMDLDIEPLLLELAWGRLSEIPVDRSSAFAAWATKIALMRSLMDQSALQSADPDLFRRYFHARTVFDPRAVQVGSAYHDLAIDSNTSKNLYSRDRATGEISVVATSNVVTYTIGSLFFQVALFDPAELRMQEEALRMLRAAREFIPEKIASLRFGQSTPLGEPLTPPELMIVREPLHILREMDFVGNTGVTNSPS
jgi:hypothetical protein